jgi:hypothetical protein
VKSVFESIIYVIYILTGIISKANGQHSHRVEKEQQTVSLGS